MACSVEGCARTDIIKSRGVCRLHYQRWRKTGDPSATRKPRRRSGRKGAVLHRPGQHNATRLETPCREWLGYRTDKGYGIYKRRRLHRMIWEWVHGPIPKGMVVLHRCDNPPCYRLDHLRLGTVAENQADMKAKGRGRKTSTNRKEVQHA